MGYILKKILNYLCSKVCHRCDQGIRNGWALSHLAAEMVAVVHLVDNFEVEDKASLQDGEDVRVVVEVAERTAVLEGQVDMVVVEGQVEMVVLELHQEGLETAGCGVLGIAGLQHLEVAQVVDSTLHAEQQKAFGYEGSD